jgi:hypothetical protein
MAEALILEGNAESIPKGSEIAGYRIGAGIVASLQSRHQAFDCMKSFASTTQGANHIFQERCVVGGTGPSHAAGTFLRRQGRAEWIAEF